MEIFNIITVEGNKINSIDSFLISEEELSRNAFNMAVDEFLTIASNFLNTRVTEDDVKSDGQTMIITDNNFPVYRYVEIIKSTPRYDLTNRN